MTDANTELTYEVTECPGGFTAKVSRLDWTTGRSVLVATKSSPDFGKAVAWACRTMRRLAA